MLGANIGANGAGPNGGLNIQVCGRKYKRDRKPLENGNFVHAVITFDGKQGDWVRGTTELFFVLFKQWGELAVAARKGWVVIGRKNLEYQVL